MVVYDLYSKREQRALGQVHDVFVYDDIPAKLRVQIVHIFNNALGSTNDLRRGHVESVYKHFVEIFRKEFGVFSLVQTYGRTDPHEEITRYLVEVADAKECIDVVEIGFRIIDKFTRHLEYMGRSGYNERADDAIEELNIRFKENGVGYQFVDGEIIRVDSQLLHAEAVKPALTLLNTKEYHGPHEEFIKAYEHYKNGDSKEALNNCLKAFESTMKAICDKRGWSYKPGDTAKALIDILFANGLVPPFWQQQFASLRSLLESSVPTGRNKLSGHGQGATPVTVPDEITAYMLHMTASTLVFLTTAERNLA